MTKKSLETLADPKKYSPDVVAVAETALQLERIADALEKLINRPVSVSRYADIHESDCRCGRG